MAKGVNIPIKGDSKSAESAIDKVTKKLNTLGKSGVTKGLSNLNGAISLVGKSFSVASAAVGKAIDVMKDLARGGRFDTIFAYRQKSLNDRTLIQRVLLTTRWPKCFCCASNKNISKTLRYMNIRWLSVFCRFCGRKCIETTDRAKNVSKPPTG